MSQEQETEESGLNAELYGEHWGWQGVAVRSGYIREHDEDARVYDLMPRRGTCVTYCLAPGQRRRGTRCPACYGQVHIRSFKETHAEPGPTRADRFAAWAGGWIASFLEAVTFPFRVGRAHTEALVRDVLQQAIEAGLRAEVVQVCPSCQDSCASNP